MILIRTNTKTNRVASCLQCKCGQKSRMVAGNAREMKEADLVKKVGWKATLEPERTPTGRIKRRGAWVHVFLCPKCQRK